MPTGHVFFATSLDGFANLDPKAAMDHLGRLGADRVYVDGGQIVQAFLRDGLIADMVLSRIPILIGEGRNLFGPSGRDIALDHVGTKTFPSGIVQSVYKLKA